MAKDFAGKTVLITGGGRGLGAHTARMFAERGADVAITYSASAEKAHAVVEELRAEGVRAMAVHNDLTEPPTARAAVASVVEELGPLGILVNNAGIAVQGELVDDPDLDEAAYDRVWQVNTLGTVAMTRAAAPHLADGGRIIFVHRDFHPGNLLWEHGQITGVVDWISSCAGPLEEDIAHCRLNLARHHGQDVADEFLHRWLRATGRSEYHPYWDLLDAVSMGGGQLHPQLDDFVARAAGRL